MFEWIRITILSVLPFFQKRISPKKVKRVVFIPPSLSELNAFLCKVGTLKHLKRTGWVYCNVNDPETVASHMYRMAMIILVADPLPKGVDRMRCIKMSLVHDVAESIVGDITPRCGVSARDKNDLEERALQVLKKMLPNERQDEFEKLWVEYEERETPNARFVKEVDLYDMLLQAFEYETTQNVHLDSFFQSCKGKFTGLLKKMSDEIYKKRSERLE